MKRTARNLVIRALGTKRGAHLSQRLAQIGLLGLGIDIGSEFEQNGEEWFANLLFKSIPNSTCADVGANVGDFTASALELGAKLVIAFEPSPAIFDELHGRFGGNGNVHLIQAAVGEAVGETTFDVPVGQPSTFASRDIGITPIAHHDSERITVAITTLDKIAQDRGVSFDIIKVDVEGFELEVLKGARDLIRNNPPKVVQFEFNTHHGKRRQTIDDFYAALPGFKLFRLASSSLRPIVQYTPTSTIYAYQNIVALREDIYFD